MKGLLARRHWIFDLDGTLTRAVHDFDAIRRELELEPGQPILEALERLPADEARPRYARLEAIEWELARQAEPAQGAEQLLETLARRGACLGVLTRNSLRNTLETLRSVGMDRFFDPAALVAREHAPPKPSPAGIHRLLQHWSAERGDALVVGDFRYDLLAGRAAGVATIYVDVSGAFPFADHADVSVQRLDQLIPERG